MSLLNSFLSAVLGLLLGSFHGLSFLLTRRRVFSSEGAHKRNLRIASLSSSILRLLFLAILFFYLLRSPSIHFILLIIGFFIAFWSLILMQRALLHERNESA